MSAPELVAGSVVAGKYTIQALLLHGGGTATYRAVTAKNREVALKLYDPAILSFPDVLKTLAQYKSIGAKLSSPQIVPISESGTDPSSRAPYTVTDFQSAPSLARLIERGPMSASEMMAMVRSLARATDRLHSSGIAILSLHPANVFVDPDAQYEARIADVGASLIRTALPAPERADRWMPWLAPEQIKGQAPPSKAADVFALALIAFFAVTGKPYWRSSSARVKDTAALRREILAERLPASVRASEFSITLNSAADAVFARALAFRPTDRYSTALEFAASLDAALSGPAIAGARVARPQTEKVASPIVNAVGTGPEANQAPPLGEAAQVRQRAALPPARKMPMPQRATMVGLGNPPAEEPNVRPATGARPPMTTMLGIGEPGAEAAPAAAAKPASPATVSAQAKTATPAKGAQAAIVIPHVAPAQKRQPPPLPVSPPPAQLDEVLVTFEADRSDRLPRTAGADPSPAPTVLTAAMPAAAPPTLPIEMPAAAPPTLPIEMPAAASPTLPTAMPAAAPPVLPTAMQDDFARERVDTGVAVLGADFAEKPSSPRRRWLASVGGLVVLAGGVAFALSGGSTTGSSGPGTSSAKVTPAAPTTAREDLPVSAESQQPVEAHRTGEHAPAAAAQPSAPVDDRNTTAPPATVPGESTPDPVSAPGAARPQPSKKLCGKFLKRCD